TVHSDMQIRAVHPPEDVDAGRRFPQAVRSIVPATWTHVASGLHYRSRTFVPGGTPAAPLGPLARQHSPLPPGSSVAPGTVAPVPSDAAVNAWVAAGLPENATAHDQ